MPQVARHGGQHSHAVQRSTGDERHRGRGAEATTGRTSKAGDSDEQRLDWVCDGDDGQGDDQDAVPCCLMHGMEWHAMPCCLMHAIPHEWKCAAATFACWPTRLIPCVPMGHNAVACCTSMIQHNPLEISTRRARRRTAKARAVSTAATAAATTATAAMHIDRPCAHASTPTSGWCRTAGWPGHP